MSEPTLEELIGRAPDQVGGFPAFAPSLAAGGEDYPTDVFAELAAVEERSFWFQGRNRILLRLFEKYVGQRAARVLEVGCGTGFVLKGLAGRFPEYELVGAEAFVQGLEFAKKRVPGVRFCQLDATKMPFDGVFDAVGYFDVLEHLDDDAGALAGGWKALKPDGCLFVTVPQHDWLWSPLDDASGHKRRYSRGGLVRKVEAAGFSVEWVSSFVTTLLPAMVLTRRGNSREAGGDARDRAIRDLSPGTVVNLVVGGAMRVDETLMAAGLSLPVGGSLVLVARKGAGR